MRNWLNQLQRRQHNLESGVHPDLLLDDRLRFKVTFGICLAGMILAMAAYYHPSPRRARIALGLAASGCLVFGFIPSKWARRERTFLNKPDAEEPAKLFKLTMRRTLQFQNLASLFFSALCVSVAILGWSSVCVAQSENPHGEKPEWCKALPRSEYKTLQRVLPDETWFEVYKLAPATFAIYEPQQYEETISYLIVGTKQALLFDTGMGIGNIKAVVTRLTSRPVVVLNSHTHNDHVGSNWQFQYIFGMDTAFTRANAKGSREDAQAELAKDNLCGDLPKDFDRAKFATKPWKISLFVHDGFKVNLGHRTVEIIATPGHTPDAISLVDRENGLLFTGDTYYPATIWLYRPETDLTAYIASVKKLAALAAQVKTVLGAHNIPVADPAVLAKLQDAIQTLLDGKVKPKSVNGDEAAYQVGDFSFRMRNPLPALNSTSGAH